MNLRILIVDDSETTRRILRAIVHSREWTVCGEAENGLSGVTQFEKLKPDIVLIDLAMPDINGIETAKRMSALNPEVPSCCSLFWTCRASPNPPEWRVYQLWFPRHRLGILCAPSSQWLQDLSGGWS